jgi:hypothetical protein
MGPHVTLRLAASALAAMILLVAPPAGAISSVSIQSAETVKRYNSGFYYYYVAEKPLPGESFYIKVTYTVPSTIPTPFKIRITLPGNIVTDHTVNVATNTVAYVPMTGIDLQEDISYLAWVDPENKANEPLFQRFDNWQANTLSFKYPNQAIEKYNTASWEGSQRVVLDVSSIGSTPKAIVTFGVPVTGTHQTVTELSAFLILDKGSGLPLQWNFSSVSSMPHNYPVYQMDASTLVDAGYTLTFESDYKINASSIRVNPTLLDSVAWSQIDALMNVNYYQGWVDSEGDVIDVGAPELASFVLSALGSNPRQSHTPYKAARALFLAVVNHMTYVTPSPSHTTADVINNATGDCGAYSMLWVAALRYLGIPARTVSAHKNSPGNHAWGEFFLPGVGWVPGDASASDGTASDSGAPYHFGSIGHLRKYLATARGNDFEIGGEVYNWLQHPSRDWSGMVSTETYSFDMW